MENAFVCISSVLVTIQEANCQFPRDIRREGCMYTVPSSSIRFAENAYRKFFYRIARHSVTVLTDVDNVDEITKNQRIHLAKVFEEENVECIVCMDHDHDAVLVPCGHYCMCEKCANHIHTTIHTCPMCRRRIDQVVTRNQIQVN